MFAREVESVEIKRFEVLVDRERRVKAEIGIGKQVEECRGVIEEEEDARVWKNRV